MDVPILYRAQNVIESQHVPTGVKTLDNYTTAFYCRYLMKRAMSAIKLTLPVDKKGRSIWPMNYVQYTLFGRGYGAVVDVPRYGPIFQGGSFYGRNVFYQPTRFMTANPLYQAPSQGWIIGKNCAFIKLQPDFCGVQDIVEMFAVRLALAYQSWQMNTQNAKFSYVFGAQSKAQAASFQSMFDRVQSGEPAVATGNNLFDKQGKPLWTVFVNDLKNNYVAPEMSEDMRAIVCEFDSYVGIPSNPVQKKERELVDEINANNDETDTLIDMWVNSLNEGMTDANELFGLSLKAEKKYSQRPANDKGGSK